MGVILGGGSYRYEVQDDWYELPAGWKPLGDVPAIAVDSRDRIFVFNRGEHPLIVFSKEGEFLDDWGADMFTKPHGLFIAPDDTIYCTDEGTHTVSRCTLDGKLLMRIGIPNQPAEYMSSRPFNRPTNVALTRGGDILVTDGYGNGAVHKFSADGDWIKSWGRPGCDAGEFNLPHDISVDENGRVLVADRENHRIQIFDEDGNFQGQWNNTHRPQCPRLSDTGGEQLIFVGEVGPYLAANFGTPNLGPRVSVLSREGKVLQRIEGHGGPGAEVGQFLSPHGMDVDSDGTLYVGEVAVSAWPSLFKTQPMPENLRSLKKLKRVRS